MSPPTHDYLKIAAGGEREAPHQLQGKVFIRRFLETRAHACWAKLVHGNVGARLGVTHKSRLTRLRGGVLAPGVTTEYARFHIKIYDWAVQRTQYSLKNITLVKQHWNKQSTTFKTHNVMKVISCVKMSPATKDNLRDLHQHCLCKVTQYWSGYSTEANKRTCSILLNDKLTGWCYSAKCDAKLSTQ